MAQILSDKSRDSKLRYEKPAVTRIGTLENITRHASTGWATDAAFPAGTPQGRLTFSD